MKTSDTSFAWTGVIVLPFSNADENMGFPQLQSEYTVAKIVPIYNNLAAPYSSYELDKC